MIRNLDRHGRQIVGGLITVALICLVGFVVSYCTSRSAAQKASAERSVAAAQATLGADAMKRADDLDLRQREGQKVTDANGAFIQDAENADQDAGDAGRRGRLAYCERQRVRGSREPDYCAPLRGAYPAKP